MPDYPDKSAELTAATPVQLHDCRRAYTYCMEQDEKQLHECCVVPYRVTGSGAEFCLVTPASENRWEFPKIRVEPKRRGGEFETCDPEVLQEAAESAGLHGELASENPLGSFVATRQSQTRSMVGFLMRVDRVEDAWPRQSSHRRLWCLAEEARVRIRRKPLRRFIDLALRNMHDPSDTSPHRSS